MFAFWIIGLGALGMAIGSLINTTVDVLLAAVGALVGFQLGKLGNGGRPPLHRQEAVKLAARRHWTTEYLEDVPFASALHWAS
jgi:hypothetical protein